MNIDQGIVGDPNKLRRLGVNPVFANSAPEVHRMIAGRISQVVKPPPKISPLPPAVRLEPTTLPLIPTQPPVVQVVAQLTLNDSFSIPITLSNPQSGDGGSSPVLPQVNENEVFVDPSPDNEYVFQQEGFAGPPSPPVVDASTTIPKVGQSAPSYNAALSTNKPNLGPELRTNYSASHPSVSDGKGTEIVVVREFFTEISTVGRLYINGVYMCYTLEDKVRTLEEVQSMEKKKFHSSQGRTAIVVGKYPVNILYRPKGVGKDSHKSPYLVKVVKKEKIFGAIQLLNVPGHSANGIRIHRGSTAEDTSGCILVGMNYPSKNMITSCTPAFDLVCKTLAASMKKHGKQITMEILNSSQTDKNYQQVETDSNLVS